MSEIVPFGKYKGQPIEALATDKSYLDWLTAQPWFRERYAGIYTLIINNFTEPNETPEHNRLQARFLDEGFRLRVFQRLLSPQAVEWSTRVQFEVGGWDVGLGQDGYSDRPALLIELKPVLGDDYPAVLRQMKANRGPLIVPRDPGSGHYFDYVQKALLIGECAAVGATFEQITAIFAASDFTVLRLADLEDAACWPRSAGSKR